MTTAIRILRRLDSRIFVLIQQVRRATATPGDQSALAHIHGSAHNTAPRAAPIGGIESAEFSDAQ
jgi:hypothetical protein